MHISVIICTYNREQIILKALQSFKKMEIPQSLTYEIIAVDNNSKDNTQKAVEEFAYKNQHLNLRYVFEKRQGLSYARNTGIKQAKGEIIAFLDDDSTPDRYWLKEIKDTFERFGCVGMGGKIIPVWKSSMPKWLATDGFWKEFMGSVISFHNLGDSFKEYTLTSSTLPGGNMAFRKVCFEKHGLFRTDLGRIGPRLRSGEDIEFRDRLLSAGEKIIYSPKAVVYHSVYEEKKFKKSYFMKLYFYTGMSFGRFEKLPKAKFFIFGVPSYEIRSFLNILVSLLFSFLRHKRKESFLLQMHLVMHLGSFLEKMRQTFIKSWRNEASCV